MGTLLHDLVFIAAQRAPEHQAIKHKDKILTYQALAETIAKLATGLKQLNLGRGERVAVFLPKYLETVAAIFGTTLADGVIVPINPVLKPDQVGHILRDCNARILITATPRLVQLHETLKSCHDLHTVITLEDAPVDVPAHLKMVAWNTLMACAAGDGHQPMNIDNDVAAILYTSGSTGRPKGVVLSHQNMIAGARSVTQYLKNSADDRLLAVLPFSFDYGLSQLTTAFTSGASVVLMDYLLPREVLNLAAQEAVTGLAAVPALWIQLAELDWPASAVQSLRYITNSGGAMPQSTVKTLQGRLPDTRIYLMYGLTEAFRSSYLPPEMIERKRGSIGKAIPNVEIMVVREDGTPCAPNEPGELVHRGALVAKGYWNQPEKTAERFRPAPAQPPGIPLPEIAVWSGDTVVKDEDGYLYFIGRQDEMIKTSGYRVSPTEIEEVLYESGLVGQAVCLGLPHPALGQGIVAVVTGAPTQDALDTTKLLHYCKQKLPNFMVPLAIFPREHLPRNPNGKIDRKLLHSEVEDYFSSAQAL